MGPPGLENVARPDDVAATLDAAWRFDFFPPADGLYTVRPLAFLSGLWALWAGTSGSAPGTGVLGVTDGVRVSQFDGVTLYETAHEDVLSVTTTDQTHEGEIVHESVLGTPLELSAQLVKASRTHIIVRCTVAARLTGAGLVRVDLESLGGYVRVPEVHVDRFDCQGFLPSDRPLVDEQDVAGQNLEERVEQAVPEEAVVRRRVEGGTERLPTGVELLVVEERVAVARPANDHPRPVGCGRARGIPVLVRKVVVPGPGLLHRVESVQVPNATWQRVADSPRTRTYHSVALLLPDGRVVVGGSTGHDLLLHRGDEVGLDE